MKRLQLGTLISVVSLVGGIALARPSDPAATTSTEASSTTKTKSPSGTMKTKSHSATGTVKEFESGKKIVVTTANKKNRSWDLDDKDTTYDVDSTIAVGSRVKVVEKTDADGKKTVSVSPYAVKTRMKSKKAKASSSPSTN